MRFQKMISVTAFLLVKIAVIRHPLYGKDNNC